MVKKPRVVVMKSLSRRRYIILASVFVLTLLIAGGLTAWRLQDQPQPEVKSQTVINLEERLKAGVPKEEDEKVEYYVYNSLDYGELGNEKKQLEQLLAADALITDRSLETGETFNLAIARVYKKLGDKPKAKDYFQRELVRMETYPEHNENSLLYSSVVKEMNQL